MHNRQAEELMRRYTWLIHKRRSRTVRVVIIDESDIVVESINPRGDGRDSREPRTALPGPPTDKC